jgi:hypothetical protein
MWCVPPEPLCTVFEIARKRRSLRRLRCLVRSPVLLGRDLASVLVSGLALAVEIGDWHRFTDNTIGSFVGLVPSEYSSGSSRIQGRSPRPATPTCDDSWSAQPGITEPCYVVGKTMRDRWQMAPAAAHARGDEGNRRTHRRWVSFIERRKRPTIADVAIAPELAGTYPRGLPLAVGTNDLSGPSTPTTSPGRSVRRVGNSPRRAQSRIAAEAAKDGH